MPRSDADVLLGQLALRRGFVTSDQLEECLDLQEQVYDLGLTENLGSILVKRGLVTAPQRDALLRLQDRVLGRREQALYGRLAVSNGFVAPEQLTEALRQQRGADRGRRIGSILLRRGFLSERQHHAILAAQGRIRETLTASAPADDEPDLTGRRIGPFRLLERIARGGMGTVYRSRQVSLDRLVAVKTLTPARARDREFYDRFLQEASTVARLVHPSIVQMVDAGTFRGTPYLVLEWVEGRSLGEELAEAGGPLPADRALEVAITVAEALEAAHREGVIHRDVKPDNILLPETGGAKVTDFGLAKVVNAPAHITDHGEIVGSPFTMSPEQAAGLDVDARADVYSLGATLFQMLTGTRLYSGPSPVAVIARVLSDPLPDPLERRSDLPAALAPILRRLCAKDREERPRSCAEVAELLRPFAKASREAPDARCPACGRGLPRPTRDACGSCGYEFASGERIPRAMPLAGILGLVRRRARARGRRGP
ncbi:MAG: protein kinase [Planctomycetales bacterium]|nr:protein kinase [Planctomycetales bacterium]